MMNSLTWLVSSIQQIWCPSLNVNLENASPISKYLHEPDYYNTDKTFIT